jgi:hypothetical protein
LVWGLSNIFPLWLETSQDPQQNGHSTMKKRIKKWLQPRAANTRETFELPSVATNGRGPGMRNALVLGNCQARPIAACLQAMNRDVSFTGFELSLHVLSRYFSSADPRLHETLSQYDDILLQTVCASTVLQHYPDLQSRARRFPVLGFSAFHPDLVYVGLRSQQHHMSGPMGHYHSALALWAYLRGLSPAESLPLFNERAYEVLGYFDFWAASRQALLTDWQASDLILGDSFENWQRAGCFMHSINHPKLLVCADVAGKLLANLALPSIPAATQFVRDEFVDGPVWPVYPEVGERLGIDGNYLFKVEGGQNPGRPVVTVDLLEFLEASFDAFGAHPPGDIQCDRLQTGAFQDFEALLSRHSRIKPAVTSSSTPRERRTPYSDLPAHQFWKSAVASMPREAVDPVVRTRFRLHKGARIATAGSCFAQNISSTLRRSGFNYFVTEPGAGLPAEEARARMFDVYSARYGNVYTARQLLQLAQRTYGLFIPTEIAWSRADGRFVDPFRPLVEPNGLESEEAVGVHLLWHLNKVRELLENLDVLIFTLGLTESWRSKADGSIFPLAPGVAGGSFDDSRYEFVNFRMSEVVEDLEQFLALLRQVNPRARMILTVSPVPLIATYEPEHALVATTYSKSVLRAAAGEVCARDSNCDYFPSYEIVTGNYARGRYFADDLRSVTTEGVDHVMRLFLKHYSDDADPLNGALMKELAAVKDIYCDEEAIVS